MTAPPDRVPPGSPRLGKFAATLQQGGRSVVLAHRHVEEGAEFPGHRRQGTDVPLGASHEALAAELVDTMLRSAAIVLRDGRLHATAEHTPVAAESLRVPFPRAWPAAAPTRAKAEEST